MATGDYLDLAKRGMYRAQRNPDVAYDAARAKELVNECILALADTGDPWDYLHVEGVWTTTAGQDLYTFSSIATALGVSEISEVEALVNDTDGSQPLSTMAWRELESLAWSTKDGDAGGEPRGWAAFNGKLRIWPAPDEVYSMGTFARRAQTELSSDTDIPLMPARWAIRVVPPYVAAGLLEQDGGNEAMNHAASYRKVYEEQMVMMRTSLATADGGPDFTLRSPALESIYEFDGGGWV